MTTKSKTAKIAKPAASAKPAAAKPTRVEHLHAMLSKTGGASIDEIAEAFSWQRHSCRGLIFTSRSKLGWGVSTAKIAERGTVYTIAAARPQAKAKAKASAKAAANPKGKRSARASA